MEELQREQLYNLLPSIYRIRDKAQGEPLRALMQALEGEARLVEEDIDALYDNWFIETCDEWTIPYIAGHVGATGPHETEKLFPSQRRQVANTIGYRRRKGLRAILEHVLADVSGWYVHCVEYDHLLASTHHLANALKTKGRLASLRQTGTLALLNGPFETTAHSIDVRNIGHQSPEDPADRALQGKYRPGNLGIFVWRLRSYPMRVVPARAIIHNRRHQPAPGCFTFDPLGRDIPLFNQPEAVDTLTSPVEPVHLPMPLDRFTLAQDLETYRAQQYTQSAESLFEEEDPLYNSLYYGPERALCVLLNDAPLPPSTIISADLSQWNLPPASTWGSESRVAIDVALGRLRFLNASFLDGNAMVAVNYCYGFSADLGGGPYTRSRNATSGDRYRINVIQGGKVSTLQQALSAWDEYCRTWEEQRDRHLPRIDRPRGTIHIVDNGSYAEHELVITLPKTSDLVIEATDGVRPVIESTLRIKSEHGNTHLCFKGLLIHGKVLIDGSVNLEIEHCTLMPYGLETHSSSGVTQIAIEHSIVGPVQVHNRQGTLAISDSIVDHAADTAIVARHPESEHGVIVSLERVTVFGRVEVQELRLALNVLFTEPVVVRDRQHGLVSSSYVPAHSQTPRRERSLSPSAELPEDEQIVPQFTSTRYGDAAYAQLATHCSPRIRRGADNGSEIGALNSLRQAQRQDNLARTLDEYLPFGLTAGVFYMT